MSKRIIHECDLTKREFDPENEKVFTLVIGVKGQGRKAPLKYELSALAAETLLAQLNGSHELAEAWGFSSATPVLSMEETSRIVQNARPSLRYSRELDTD